MKTLPGLLCALLLLPAISMAEEEENEKGGSEGKSLALALRPGQVDVKWQQECSSCHIAYAPGLLPAESWRRVMAGLDQHFGTDASLTPTESREITDFLVRYGTNRWSGAAAPIRITETSGFVREHRGDEVPAGAFKRASVKSAANCQACHSAAANGDFNEHGVRIPN
jgi:mono/diheme cytochrome c family protein